MFEYGVYFSLAGLILHYRDETSSVYNVFEIARLPLFIGFIPGDLLKQIWHFLSYKQKMGTIHRVV